MVDLTRDAAGVTKARLLDLVPGRSGEADRSWSHERGPAFRDRVEIATLDPFRGYNNAIDDQLEDARAVLGAFHIVKLGTKVVDDVRRRVQQLRTCYHQASHRDGRALAERVLPSLPSCTVPEVARLGRTLRTWRREFLGYFDTPGANNGSTDAINGLTELHLRIARGFLNRDNYRPQMPLIGTGLFT